MKLSVQNLSYSYENNNPILSDVSFDLEKGDILSVIGPNGSGKTTLFKCLLHQLIPLAGSICIDGTDIRTLSPKKRATKMAYIPQLSSNAFSYSVYDTVLMGTVSSISPLSLPGKSQHEAAERAMALVGISHLAERPMSHLSGGERQLAHIARAIAQEADILIMDEPTSALDYGNQIKVMNLVTRLAKQEYTILISMHNPKAARKYATKTIAILDHKVKAFGISKEIITEDFINELYSISE